ncbi:hypothetical protein JL100_005320 [Skermanella mucosa]|uniref:hypothetical protein n=1 Tax=Skermanella mucosa TaxID=1789672 RepID=UPI00192CC34E|nr:hypothetical protein [Skermanella mucosa]UEM22171.1 hypothetical protein JL100_005320 [Skermanella mucosa]
MPANLKLRPGTLAEAIRRYNAGQQKFGVALGEFLDEFYLDREPSSRRARIKEAPEFVGADIIDAYVGAVGEHLARRWKLGDPPE